MILQIRTDGYYISEPFRWVDWHASIKFEGDNFYVIKFDSQKCYFDSFDDVEKINLSNIMNEEHHGLYKINENILEILYNPNTEYELKKIFTIVSSELLLDENLKEYRYEAV